MITIAVGRTVSANFQSQKFEIQFELPESVSLAEGTALGNFLVNAKLLRRWDLDSRAKFADLYEKVFDENIDMFLKLVSSNPHNIE